MYYNPFKPNKLWAVFKDCMTKDFSRRHSKEDAYLKTLIDIQSILQCEGKSLDDFPQLQYLIQEINKTNFAENNIDESCNPNYSHIL